MSIPEQFSEYFDRIKTVYLENTSMLWPSQAVEGVMATLSDVEVRDIVIELCGYGVKFWVHNCTAEPLPQLPVVILALPLGSYWSAMMPLNLDMPMPYLRRQISSFFSHFVAYDDEVTYTCKQRQPVRLISHPNSYPFGESDLSFGLPGYNC